MKKLILVTAIALTTCICSAQNSHSIALSARPAGVTTNGYINDAKGLTVKNEKLNVSRAPITMPILDLPSTGYLWVQIVIFKMQLYSLLRNGETVPQK